MNNMSHDDMAGVLIFLGIFVIVPVVWTGCIIAYKRWAE